ncbi:hypothetical protein CspHIS471_0101940 [Cutaneotrichosporon sp. HIS471]|nr:hypothetical protein CspHIS471_0101940 [Cutaneotrichosporon sp. HIS471]
MSESSVRFSTPSEASSSAVASASKRTDIREYLDPQLPRDVNGSDAPPDLRPTEVGDGEDPITQGLVTTHEAETLLALYMRHLNPMTATLDPYLYTLPYLRAASLILLSSLLAIAAKFFRRPLYRALLAHANAVVDRAVGLGLCNIGLIQSLILIVCWKDPTDASSWLKLGIGIRLGYQLGLHLPRNHPLPSSEVQARKIANHERTWYTLSSFDRLYSDVYSLPPTVKLDEIPDAVSWAEETAWLGCGDMRHACSFSSASTYRMWVKYRRNLATMSPDLSWAILTDLYGQIEQHMKRWFPLDPSTGKITELEQVFLKWFDLNHLLKIKWHMLDLCAPNERDGNVIDWLHLAELFTLQTEAIGLTGILRYFQDTSATHISSFGVMVYNLFSRLPHFQRHVVTGYVRRLSKCCDSATLGDGETVMGFVGRFMQRLLHVLVSSEEEHTLPESEVPLPENPANAGALLDLDDFFLGMLQNGTDPFANLVPGQEFWFDPNVVLS